MLSLMQQIKVKHAKQWQKEQEHATLRAEQETKQYHQRIRGRCVLPSEAQAQQRQNETRPADPARIAYIQQLKKDLKLKKYSTE